MLVAGHTLGAYRIVRLLGAGGMGEVYEARDTRLDRLVAIKVLPQTTASEASARERFEQEARSIAALNHPNICTLHDVGHAHGREYLVMERLEGETLQHRLRSSGLPIADCVELGIALAEALAFAHSRGILHRDIKPANIFLTPHGPKFLDFGLAKVLPVADGAVNTSDAVTQPMADPMTDTGLMVGTVPYMSPEQLRGEPLDARSDLFSFGLVLYEMVTGQRAFGGSTIALVAAAILEKQPPSPGTHASVPPRLDDVIMKALEKPVDDRYQTAIDLCTDLRRVRRQLSISSATSAPFEHSADVSTASSNGRIPTPPRRSRDILIVSGFAALLGVAALAGLMSWPIRSADPPGTTPSGTSDLQFVPLTSSGTASRPALSGDGRYVVFVQQDADESSLWLRQTAIEGGVQIVPAQRGVSLLGAAISPDGRFVDFVRAGPTQQDGRQLWRVPLLGGVARRLRTGVQSLPGWSLDSQRMAWLAIDVEKGETSLVVADANADNERAIDVRRSDAGFFTFFSVGVPTVLPAWSPDGRFIAVAGFEGDATQLILVDSTTGQERSRRIEHAVSGLAWLDAESVLAVQRVGLTSTQLWRIPVAGGAPTRVTTDLSAYETVSMSSDRDVLAAGRSDTRVSLWVGTGDGGTGRDIATSYWPSSDLTNATVTWAGARVLATQNTQGQPSVVAFAADGTRITLVENASGAVAAADGQTIVFWSERAPGLWRSDGDGRNQKRLSELSSAIAVTPDGREAIVLSDDAGVQVASRMPIAGGPSSPVTHAFTAAQAVDLSPDGQRLMFVSREQNQRVLVVCDYPKCADIKKWKPSGPPRRMRWTPDGRGIAYLDQATESNIWVQPLDGARDYQLTRFTDRRRIGDFAWSRDGSRLAVSRGITTSDIVLIRGLRHVMDGRATR